MYSDAEPIASPFVDWDARRKAVPCRANHKMLSLAAVAHSTQPSQNECQLATLENPSRLQRGRSRQAVFHIPTDPGVGAVDPKLARLVEQGEKANMSPWVMVEMGYEMGYSPKDVMEALSNDSRAKMGLPPKPVGEGPVIHVFKGAAKEVDHGGVDAGDETSAAARSIPLQLGASPLDQFNKWKEGASVPRVDVASAAADVAAMEAKHVAMMAAAQAKAKAKAKAKGKKKTKPSPKSEAKSSPQPKPSPKSAAKSSLPSKPSPKSAAKSSPPASGKKRKGAPMPPRPKMPKVPCTTEWWGGKILASTSKEGWRCFWDASSVKEKTFKYGDNKAAAFTKALDCIEAYQRGSPVVWG